MDSSWSYMMEPAPLGGWIVYINARVAHAHATPVFASSFYEGALEFLRTKMDEHERSRTDG